MAYLPKEPIELHGGCFCSAIKYKVSVPALDGRPLAPNAVPTPTDPYKANSETAPTRFPIFDIDHCESCRRACGSILMVWFIIPPEWCTFYLLEKSNSITDSFETNPKDRDPRITFSGDRVLEVINPTKEVLAETYVGHFSSSKEVHRLFCSRCGTNITYHTSEERPMKTLDLTMGSLDKESLEKEGVRPDRHGWWDDGIDWIRKLVTNGDGTMCGGGLSRHPAGAMSKVLEK